MVGRSIYAIALSQADGCKCCAGYFTYAQPGPSMMRTDHFSDLISDFNDGIQDAGILIDQGNFCAAKFAELLLIQQQKFAAVEANRTPSQPGRGWEEVQERKSQRGLARARLT